MVACLFGQDMGFKNLLSASKLSYRQDSEYIPSIRDSYIVQDRL